MRFRFSQSGFTLIEFLIYISLVSGILLVAGVIGLNTLLGKAKLLAIEEVSQNGRLAIVRIAATVRNAQAINSPSPGSSTSTLSLQMADSANNPTVFELVSNSLRIKEGSQATTTLTTSEVLVSSLQFSNLSYSNTSGTIRAQMTIGFNNPDGRQEYSFSKTFFTTENIRVR